MFHRKGLYVFCGDHGITDEGVSLYPSVVTREMVKNFVHGGAAVSVLCRQLGIITTIVDTGIMGDKIPGALDMRIAEGTRNFLTAPAMSKAEAVLAIENGIRLAQEAALHLDIAGVGEMGIGNSTSASALLYVLAGVSPEEAVGRGTGLDEAGVQHKLQVLKTALATRTFDRGDVFSVVAAFGGYEIATMAGFLLGAAARKLAVVVDGFISGAAFLIAQSLVPNLGQHCFFAHRSAERGHTRLLAFAGAEPLLDLGMCLGEGTGAALGIGLLQSAVALYSEMATFTEASVSDIAVSANLQRQ